jgi:hypothetical protein
MMETLPVYSKTLGVLNAVETELIKNALAGTQESFKEKGLDKVCGAREPVKEKDFKAEEKEEMKKKMEKTLEEKVTEEVPAHTQPVPEVVTPITPAPKEDPT